MYTAIATLSWHCVVVSGWFHWFICWSWHSVHSASNVRFAGSTAGQSVKCWFSSEQSLPVAIQTYIVGYHHLHLVCCLHSVCYSRSHLVCFGMILLVLTVHFKNAFVLYCKLWHSQNSIQLMCGLYGDCL